MEKCEQLESESQSLKDENTAKRPRIESEEISWDPLKLPEPCVRTILSNFSGKELLDVMEVSTYWKNYIESSKFLMNRAMDEVIVWLDESMVEAESFEPLLLRRFKHVYTTFPKFSDLRKSLRIFDRMKFYAESLEILNIECGCALVMDGSDPRRLINQEIVMTPSNFSNLQKLSLCNICNNFGEEVMGMHNSFADFISTSKFPKVTELFIGGSLFLNFERFILNFPELKVLHIDCEPLDESSNVAFEPDLLDYQQHDDQPKIEVLYMVGVNESLLRAFRDTVTELHLPRFLESHHLRPVLSELHRLESLTVWEFSGKLDDSVGFIPYLTNKSIKYLDIHELDDTTEEDLHTSTLR